MKERDMSMWLKVNMSLSFHFLGIFIDDTYEDYNELIENVEEFKKQNKDLLPKYNEE